MEKRLLAIVLALVCAMGAMGLVACGNDGGASGSQAAGSAASDAAGSAAEDTASGEASQSADGQAEEPAPSDEELIGRDVDAFFKTVLGKESLADILRSNGDMAELEQAGMDIDAFAGALAAAVKVEVESVAVDGETAVATAKMTVPDFESGMDARMEQALQDVIGDQDISSMGDEDMMRLFNQAVQAVLADPELPTTSETVDIEYMKENGTWGMKDKDAAAQITAAMTGAVS